MTEIVETIRQEWHECYLDEDLSNYVTIMSEQGHQLILMQYEKFWGYEGNRGFRYVPVNCHDMKEYAGEN